MLRIALCDDEDVFLNYEKEIVSDYLKQKGLTFRIECFPTGERLLKDKIQLDTFDLVILDVEMTGLDGISVAKAIRANNTKVNIAFLSAHMTYSTDGYRVNAVRYFLKDKDDLREYLQECIDHVLETINQNDWSITLDFTIGERELKISDIVFLKTSGNYTVFVVSFDSKETYMIRKPLKSMTDIMHAFDFVSVSSKETVNLSHVSSVSRYKASLDTGVEVSISQKKYNAVYRAYTLYRGKHI